MQGQERESFCVTKDGILSIQLPGTNNFRSLKGLPAHGGRRIAGHTVLRSDQLNRLGADDWAALQSLGVRTVCDLRSPTERARYPNRLPAQGIQELPMGLLSDIRADPSFAAMLRAKPNADGAVDMMCEIYRRMPGLLFHHLPALFGLFESGDVPVLVHCAAGKDRTGFVVAVLLHALGVAPEHILEDYLLSSRSSMVTDPHKRQHMSQMVFELVGQTCSESMVDAILAVHPDYLQAAFDAVDQQWGSMEAYLHAGAQMHADKLDEFRGRWLSAG
jgi:protein-tyrosine phosphatase